MCLGQAAAPPLRQGDIVLLGLASLQEKSKALSRRVHFGLLHRFLSHLPRFGLRRCTGRFAVLALNPVFEIQQQGFANVPLLV